MQFEDLDPKERQAYVKHRTQANMHMLQSKKAKSSRSKFHLNAAKFHQDAMCELLKIFEADAIIEKLQSVGKPLPALDPKSWWYTPAGVNIGVVIQQVHAATRSLNATWTTMPMTNVKPIGLHGDVVWLKK